MPKRLYQRGRWLVVALCLIYTLGILVFYVVRVWKPDEIPLVSLLNAFFPFLFAPLVLTFPLAVVARSKGLFFTSLGVLAVFAYTFGAFFLPRWPVASETDSLQVMTFNVGPGQSTAEDIVAVIEKQNPDIVALQELVPEVTAGLQRRLQEQYPYMLLGTRRETTGLLSRHPVLQSEWSEPNGSGRGFLHALVDWRGHPIHFFAVHPPPPGIRWFADSIPIGLENDQPERAITSVVEQVDSTDGSKIVAGDLNMSDQTRAYARLTQALSDSYREAGQGFGFTFPNKLMVKSTRIPGPFVRLDYILHSDDWVTLQASVHCEQSSDHCYLVAQLAFKP